MEGFSVPKNPITGYAEKSLDQKGRVALPPDMLSKLNTLELYLVPWSERCVAVLREDQHDAVAQHLRDQSFTGAQGRKANRLFFAGVTSVKADAQSRIVLSERLKKYAGIGEDVAVVGAGTHIEVWAQDRFEAYFTDADDDNPLDTIFDAEMVGDKGNTEEGEKGPQA